MVRVQGLVRVSPVRPTAVNRPFWIVTSETTVFCRSMVMILPLVRRRSRAPEQTDCASANPAMAAATMNRNRYMIRVYLLAAVIGIPLFAAVSGEEVFKQRCAGCHEQNNPRIPRVAVLHRMPAARILRTLNWGVMGNVAYTMTIAEREAVASYLGTSAPPAAMPPAAFCADRAVRFVTDAKAKVQPSWNGWSPSAT